MKFVPVLEKFSEYCNPRKNITILRHNFLTYRQHLQENFCDFVRELKKLSSEYEFETLQDSLIKDMIACGTNDKSLRELHLGESDTRTYLHLPTAKEIFSQMLVAYFSQN